MNDPPPQPGSSRRWIWTGIAAAALLAGVALGLLFRHGLPSLPAVPDPAPGVGIARGPFSIGGEFDLLNHDGGRTRLADLRGQVVLLFFGYTHCPDICPTTLADMRLAIRSLGSDAARVRGVFVSVDPQRDTPERLRDYVGAFDADLLGLTGSAAEIAAVTARYGVAYQVDPPGEDGSYNVGHSAFSYLVDPEGRVQALFAYGTPWQQVADEVRRYL